MSLCGAVATRRLQVPTHALLLSVVGAMKGTSASWASKLGSREGWSKHFRSGFCKRTVLRLNPWACSGRRGKQMIAAPLSSILSSSPLFFLHRMFFLHYFPPVACCPCLSKSPPAIFFASTTLKSLISSLLWLLVPSYCSPLPLGSWGLCSYPSKHIRTHQSSPLWCPWAGEMLAAPGLAASPLHMVPALESWLLWEDR